MILVRTQDAEFFDAIVNDPSVRKTWALDGWLSVTDFLGDASYIAFKSEGGGFIFQEVLPNIYTVHIMFRRGVSSKTVRSICKKMMQIMFLEYGAEALHAKIESKNYVTTRLGRNLGFCSMAVRHEFFNGEMQKVEHMALTREMWRPN